MRHFVTLADGALWDCLGFVRSVNLTDRPPFKFHYPSFKMADKTSRNITALWVLRKRKLTKSLLNVWFECLLFPLLRKDNWSCPPVIINTSNITNLKGFSNSILQCPHSTCPQILPDLTGYFEWYPLKKLIRNHWQPGKSEKKVFSAMLADDHQWPLLLTWFNFNPSMDK